MNADRITLSGLRVHAHHGVFDFEREQGQDFVIDVVAWLDLAPAARGDELAATVHYGELAEAVAEAVASDPVDLIETVAERVARVALSFPVEHVEVTVHKPSAPISVPFDDVAVTVVRDRAWADGTTAPAGALGRSDATTQPDETPGEMPSGQEQAL
ncbi:dihydroneopterin aldolase [Planctomonas sp. JC2975]|uniref:dihydroneopterin aldolase n=1 Tax=Planctomonas sp. JC2975 TaxID=2729626 RepID=UPI001475A59D|nr:dihydroneopterin aldolase [Planctomonas sp. JC2975]NNC12073.1 dihydroneopterin aldolase [Planctomonas sp. JC2975]